MYALLLDNGIPLLPVSPPLDTQIATELTSYSETRNKTLEEIASAFGDKVVTLTEREIFAEQTVFEGKAATGHIESAQEDDSRS